MSLDLGAAEDQSLAEAFATIDTLLEPDVRSYSEAAHR